MCIRDSVIAQREAFGRPDHAELRARPRRRDVGGGLVDDHLGAALIVMAGDDAADLQAHKFLPYFVANYKGSSTGSGFLPLSCQSRNTPEPTTMAEPASSGSVGTSPQNRKPSTSAHTKEK